MSDQDFPRGAAGNVRAQEGASEWTTKAAKDALSRASAFAEEAGGGKVKQAASDTAETITGEVKEILNRQVGGGADMLGNVARSVRRAAEDIERNSPQIADLARTLATRVDGYAHRPARSVGRADLAARRGPHTAAAGGGFRVGSTARAFLRYKIVKSSPSVPAPPIQPSLSYRSGGGGISYGA